MRRLMLVLVLVGCSGKGKDPEPSMDSGLTETDVQGMIDDAVQEALDSLGEKLQPLEDTHDEGVIEDTGSPEDTGWWTPPTDSHQTGLLVDSQVERILDYDQDGYCPQDACPWPLLPGDCDDMQATTNPGADELPYDDVDNDCDGACHPSDDCSEDTASTADSGG